MEIVDYIPKIIRASLDNDSKAVRLISLNVLRRIKKDNPKVAEEIAKALDYNAIGASTRRSMGIYTSPIDKENKDNLLKVEEPIKIERPIFDENMNSFIDEFIYERNKSLELLNEGLLPTSSIILYGPTGSGKTHLAKYLAGELNLKFATLDLATSISSYLGKTGQNLKNVIEYAKEEPTLLLLDEFDSIAKKRDDNTELGELKRIVNVLLKELEEWPYYSVIIAATNYPDLLDKAIWRRFDISLEVEYPSSIERKKIIDRALGIQCDKISEDVKMIIANVTDGLSPDNIIKIVTRARKAHILKKEDILKTILLETIKEIGNGNTSFNKEVCKLLKENTNLSISKIADLIGKSKSTVQYYLK
ncbi:ATP-dependent zinc metalloprotease FtsH 1 [Clostridium perfringens]|uniref:AAA family ATPase n=1 Tax=Clostridium perfringens TaxID=1502 RepID=UPI0024441A56|nr:ATP-binding protein [Clostridium perfringens]MDG6879876.1 ATP-dependent zinc metalloprotease FtsH 1 [Clostridium perfringens]MDM0468570.1 ATP-binding protein [Clostridium perfringens]